MTAEIVLLNREAVVMAADSAVTIEGRSATKVYHSENKLFMLSKYRPVGVMIYNSVHLCGVPWETIIKEYRRQLKDSPLDTLNEYADDFWTYLKGNDYLFASDLQLTDNAQSIVRRLKELHEIYQRKVGEGIKKAVALNGAVDEKLKQLKGNKFLEGFNDDIENKIRSEFSETIRILAEQVFERKKFPNGSLEKIIRWIGQTFTRTIYPSESTGVIITGFGEKEVFPRLRCFTVESVIFGTLKFSEGEREEISLENPATWRSFAQSDVVSSIIGGIHPRYRNNFLRGAFLLVHDNVMAALEEIVELTSEQRKAYEDALTKKAVEAWRKYFHDMDGYAREQFEEPVRRSLDGLGKDDLAKVAESLVSITSFRQQISPEEETVGGPIDIAVISKGDGFVWIKRKFYFDIKFNPHFLERYYKNT